MSPQDKYRHLLAIPFFSLLFLTLATDTYRWCWWMQRSQWTYHDVIVSSDKEQANQSMYGMFTYITLHSSLLIICIFPTCKQKGTIYTCNTKRKMCQVSRARRSGRNLRSHVWKTGFLDDCDCWKFCCRSSLKLGAKNMVFKGCFIFGGGGF